MRKFSISPIALVVLLAPGFAPDPAAAQDPEVAGVFELGPGASEEVDRAIRTATEGAGFFVRTLGRRMLGEKLQPVPTIRIVLTDSTASITTEAAEELRTPLSGPDSSGPTDAVMTRWDGATLVRTFREDEGVRRYRYTLDPDGRTLRVGVRVEGSKLPRPVEYELTYHR